MWSRKGSPAIYVRSLWLLLILATWRPPAIRADSGIGHHSLILPTEKSPPQSRRRRLQEQHHHLRKYLYNRDGESAEPVLEYQDENNDHPDFLYSAEQGPRVVEFYAPWCPHCRHYKHKYVELARNVTQLLSARPGAPVVHFYAVSCTVHRAICKDWLVSGYPQVRLLPAGTKTVEQGVRAKYFQLQAQDVITQLNIDLIQYPLPSNTNSEHDQTINASKPTQNAPTTLLNQDPYTVTMNSLSALMLPNQTLEEVYQDAYRSLEFTLRNGVYMGKDDFSGLDAEECQVLKDFINLMHFTIATDYKFLKLIPALLNQADVICEREQLLTLILDEYPPSGDYWSYACTKGVLGAGYTCGMWQLFHIITVGVVEWNRHFLEEEHAQNRLSTILDQSNNFGKALSTVQAADTIRNVVQHFFGCDECRTNFVKAYEACEFDRCNRLSSSHRTLEQWIRLPFWLFLTHNAVSMRVYQEQAEREGRLPSRIEILARQWPPPHECPSCRRGSVNTDTNTEWDEIAVFRHLRKIYWPADFENWVENFAKMADVVDIESSIWPSRALINLLTAMVLVLMVVFLQRKWRDRLMLYLRWLYQVTCRPTKRNGH